MAPCPTELSEPSTGHSGTSPLMLAPLPVNASPSLPLPVVLQHKVGDSLADRALGDDSPRSRSNEPYEALSDAMKSDSLAASVAAMLLSPWRRVRASVCRRPSRDHGKWACAVAASFVLVLLLPLALRSLRAPALQDDPNVWSPPPERGTQLSGSLELTPGVLNRSHHFGGFCFGHSSLHDVISGTLWLDVQLPTVIDRPDDDAANVAEQGGSGLFLALYDDEPKHWGFARERWETSSCTTKLQYASMVEPVVSNTTRAKFCISEAFARHWHIALVPCGAMPFDFRPEEPPVLEYRLVAWGDLATFKAGDLDPEGCPGEPIQLIEDKVYSFLM